MELHSDKEQGSFIKTIYKQYVLQFCPRSGAKLVYFRVIGNPEFKLKR